ncbi:UNVERIFIED_ORG: hypothetical protein GGI57_004076 [Rhizobium aethiopicum]
MTDNFDSATAAARRCARRLEKQGVDREAIADAFFAEAAGRYAAVTGDSQSIRDLATLWTMVGMVARIGGADASDQ